MAENKRVFLLIGVPSSGKSWVAKHLGDKVNYVSHDDHIDQDYVRSIIKKYQSSDPRPLLIETPFGMNDLVESLKQRSIEITPLFITEHPIVLSQRYFDRENKDIPKGHLTRQNTYLDRAKKLNAFAGTSKEVLKHLHEIIT